MTDKQVTIESMDVTLSKATVRREGAKDEPKRAMAYLTFATLLTRAQLVEFGLSDIAHDPRFKMGEEIVLSPLRQGLQGTITLTVCTIVPVTGEVKPIVESPGMLTKMTLTGEVFGVEVSYPVTDNDGWVTFGDMFTNLIGQDMKITAMPDNRGKQEPLIKQAINKAVNAIGENLHEDESVTFVTGERSPVTVQGKKKRVVKQ